MNKRRASNLGARNTRPASVENARVQIESATASNTSSKPL